MELWGRFCFVFFVGFFFRKKGDSGLAEQQDKAWSPYTDGTIKAKTWRRNLLLFVLTGGERLFANAAPPDFYSPTALRVPLLSWSDREEPAEEQRLLNGGSKNKNANSSDGCFSTFS